MQYQNSRSNLYGRHAYSTSNAQKRGLETTARQNVWQIESGARTEVNISIAHLVNVRESVVTTKETFSYCSSTRYYLLNNWLDCLYGKI